MNPFPLLNKSLTNTLPHNRSVRDPVHIGPNTSSISITALPADDVLPIVFSYLSLNDLVSLEKTCTLFNRVIRQYHLKECALYYHLFENTGKNEEADFEYWANREYQRLKLFFTANNHQILALPARKELKKPFLHFHLLRELICSHTYEFKLLMQFPNVALWGCAVSPCGRFLLTQSSAVHLVVWRFDAMCNKRVVGSARNSFHDDAPVFSSTGKDFITSTLTTVFISSIDNDENWHQAAQINFNLRVTFKKFTPSGCLALFCCSNTLTMDERVEEMNIWVWGRDRQGCWSEQTVIKHDSKIMGVRIAPAEQHILSHSKDNIIKIHSRDKDGNWSANGVIYHQNKINNLDFSTCGRHILTHSKDLTARIWTCNEQGQWAEQKILRHSDEIRHALISDSGDSVATCAGSTVQLWTYTDAWRQRVTPHCDETITSIQFSPSGEHLLVGTQQGRIMLLDRQGGAQYLVNRGAEVCRSVFSESGNCAVTILKNHIGIIWSFNNHGCKAQGRIYHNEGIERVLFLQHDRQIMSWARCGDRIKVWSYCDNGTWKESTAIKLGAIRYLWGLQQTPVDFSSRQYLLITNSNEIWGRDEKGCWRRKGKIPLRCLGDETTRILPCQSRLLLCNSAGDADEIWEIYPGKTVNSS